MPNITSTGTVWNLPNFGGQVYSSSPTVTPLLSAIAAKAVRSDNFQFPTGTTYGLGTASQPEISESDSLTAPVPVGYVRSQDTNVTQIFQEKISVSYARLANSGRLSGVTGSAAAVPDELEFQTARALEKIAGDIEYTFINGVYQLSTGAGVANKSRGLLSAITTNATDLAGSALSKSALSAALAGAYSSGASFREMTFICGAAVKQALTDLYASQWGFSAPPTRNVGGVNVTTIETDFGVVSVMLDRFAPANTLIGADLAYLRPVEQEVPGKGNFFREQLSKTGASEEYQIFGQIGLDYGPEWMHFAITGIGSAE